MQIRFQYLNRLLQLAMKSLIPLERAIADPVCTPSWKSKFPLSTRLPKDVGGGAPDGLDCNGVLNILSQTVVFSAKTLSI